MNKAEKKVIIAFRHFGAYHYARLNALAKDSNFEILALELSGKGDRRFEGDVDESGCLKIKQLFPESDILNLPAAVVYKKIYEILDDAKPDVVVVPGWGTRHSLVMLCWCLENSVPSVLMSDSTENAQQRFSAKEFFKRSIVQMFNSVLVAGTSHAEYVKKLGMPSSKIYKGFDVVDNSYFKKETAKIRENSSSIRDNLKLPENYFLIVSRFVHVKNIARVLKAYALYKKQKPSLIWDLVIIGDGVEQPVLHDVCQLLPELSEGIHFIGSKEYQVLPSYYALAKAFILASISETWGLVVNEAMASGLPVILSNKCGCAAELLVDGENGYLFDPYDESDIAKAMTKISSSEIDLEKMGQKSSELISTWDLNRFTEGLTNAITAALDNKPIKRGFLGYFLLKFFTKF